MDFQTSDEKEMPHPAKRSSPHWQLFAESEECRRFVYLVCGGYIPPEIIDDEVLFQIKRYIIMLGVEKGASYFKKSVGHLGLVMLRAVRLNVTKLRNENNGKLPWEA